MGKLKRKRFIFSFVLLPIGLAAFVIAAFYIHEAFAWGGFLWALFISIVTAKFRCPQCNSRVGIGIGANDVEKCNGFKSKCPKCGSEL